MLNVADVETDQRKRILRATAECISQHGLGGATIRRVAQFAGVSIGMLQYYYPTKKSLLAAAHVAAVARLRERALSISGGSAGRRRLNSMFTLLRPSADEDMPAWSFWLWYWAEASLDPELRLQHDYQLRLSRDMVAESIRIGIEAGEFREDLDPVMAADLAVCLLHGLAVETTSAPEVISLDRALAVGEMLTKLFACQGPTKEA